LAARCFHPLLVEVFKFIAPSRNVLYKGTSVNSSVRQASSGRDRSAFGATFYNRTLWSSIGWAMPAAFGAAMSVFSAVYPAQRAVKPGVYPVGASQIRADSDGLCPAGAAGLSPASQRRDHA